MEAMIFPKFEKTYHCQCGRFLRVKAVTYNGLTEGFHDAGWIGIDGKQYCPHCYFFDERELKYKAKR